MKRILLWLVACLTTVIASSAATFYVETPSDWADDLFCWVYTGDGTWCSDVSKVDLAVPNGCALWKVVTDEKNVIFCQDNEWKAKRGGKVEGVSDGAVYIAKLPTEENDKGEGTGLQQFVTLESYAQNRKIDLGGSGELHLYDNLYIRGAFGGNWGVYPERHLVGKRQTDGSIVYTSPQFDFTQNRQFLIGTDEAGTEGKGWTLALGATVSNQEAGLTYHITRESYEGGHRSLDLMNGGKFLVFEYTLNGVITLTQYRDSDGKECWRMGWEVPEVKLPEYELYLRGGHTNWEARSENILTCEKQADGAMVYTIDANIPANTEFKFGTKEATDWAFALTASSLRSEDGKNNAFAISATTPQPLSLYGDAANDNMYFTYGFNGTITVTNRTNGNWLMEFTSEQTMSSVRLTADEFDNRERSLDFTYNEATQKYELKLEYQSKVEKGNADEGYKPIVSTVLTNRFNIEYGGTKFGTVQDDRYIIDGKPVIPTGVGVGLQAGGSSYQLADRALQNVTMVFDPKTSTLTINGDKMPELSARQYTVYYKLTAADYNDDKSLKNVYLWAWGNSTEDALHLRTMNSTTFPGDLISKQENLVEVEGEKYYRISLTIPEGNSSVGVLFSHDADEKSVNILDYDFFDGKVYSWDKIEVANEEERAAFFAKVALRVVNANGERVNLEMTTEDGVNYYLGDASNTYDFANLDGLGEYDYFYVIRTRNSMEKTDGGEPDLDDYYYHYSHQGGVAYWKDYTLLPHDGTMTDHTGCTGMQLVSDQIDGLYFSFDLAHGVFKAMRNEDPASTVHYTIFLWNHEHAKGENAGAYAAPHLLAYAEDGEGNTVVFTGNESGYGEAMHQYDSGIMRNEAYWRYDLYIPASFRLKKGNAQESTSGVSVITPDNASTFGTSAVHLKFSDAGNDEVMFANAPLIDGGVYANNTNDNAPVLATTMYLIDANTGGSIATLKETNPGVYLYSASGINFSEFAGNAGVLKLYVSSSATGKDGKYYGATEPGISDIYTQMVAKKADYMLEANSTNTFDFNIADMKTAGLNPESVAVKVEINPIKGYYQIGFGSSLSDIDTAVDEISAEDEPVYWFNLQGVRLEKPVPGLNIRVQGKKSVKVLVK